jgi:hypothetical protein
MIEPMEHRWGERVRVSVPVRVSAHAFSGHTGRLTNLSVSGGHLQVDTELRLLSRVEIVVVLPYRSKHEAPAVQGYVTRKYRDGFGIEWCEFAPAVVADLLRAAVRHPYTTPLHSTPRRTGLQRSVRPRTAGSLLKHAQ